MMIFEFRFSILDSVSADCQFRQTQNANSNRSGPTNGFEISGTALAAGTEVQV